MVNNKLKVAFAFQILLLLSFQVVSNPSDKRGLVPTDYFDFVFVSDPQVSPNGKNILFVKTTVKEDASGRNKHLYIIQEGQPHDASLKATATLHRLGLQTAPALLLRDTLMTCRKSL